MELGNEDDGKVELVPAVEGNVGPLKVNWALDDDEKNEGLETSYAVVLEVVPVVVDGVAISTVVVVATVSTVLIMVTTVFKESRCVADVDCNVTINSQSSAGCEVCAD